jgi:hypothetical protein
MELDGLLKRHAEKGDDIPVVVSEFSRFARMLENWPKR